jgi:hypothetical protein
MSSQSKIDANRENAKKSTGPRSPQGKAASSRNSLRHGLCAEKYLLLDEDPAAYTALVADHYQRFRPVGEAEEYLVLRIANNQWRLHRAGSIDTQIHREGVAIIVHINPQFSQEQRDAQSQHCGSAFMDDCHRTQSLLKLQRYEAALERSNKECIRQLNEFRQARLEAEAEAAEEAEKEVVPERTQTNEGIAPPPNEGVKYYPSPEPTPISQPKPAETPKPPQNP